MPLSKRQRREISAGSSLRISIEHQNSSGAFLVRLTEDASPTDIEHYASGGHESIEEAATVARHEWEALVEKRVDAMEAEDYRRELSECATEDERREVIADWRGE